MFKKNEFGVEGEKKEFPLYRNLKGSSSGQLFYKVPTLKQRRLKGKEKFPKFKRKKRILTDKATIQNFFKIPSFGARKAV